MNDVNTSSVAVDGENAEFEVISIDNELMQSVLEHLQTNFPTVDIATVAVNLRFLSDLIAKEVGFSVEDGSFQ